MRKTGLLLLAVLSWTMGQLSAQPDPRDSIILESKIVAPNLSGDPAFVMKVYLTNKDTITYMVLSLRAQTISGNGYAVLDDDGAGGRDFPDIINAVNNTLDRSTFFDAPGYDEVSPDSFIAAGGFAPTPSNPRARSESPNSVRDDVWEIRFKSTTSSFGEVKFDTVTIGQPTGIAVIRWPGPTIVDVPINFVSSIIQVGLPLQLQLVAPPNGGVVPETRPTLIWNALRDTVAVPATYNAWLADNPSFTPSDSSPSLTDTTWQVPFDLLPQTDYYWKVRAVSDFNDTVFSEVRGFRLAAPPTAPVDISPPSGSDMSMFDYLVWLESTDPDPGDQVTYHLQIDDNSNFSSPEVDQSGISENTLAREQIAANLRVMPNALAVPLNHLIDHDKLKDDSLYYWRVRAQDSYGASSVYTSGQRKFYLNLADSSPRPVPGGFIPSGGIVINIHQPNFSWFQASDPDPDDPPSSLLYHLRLDTDGEISDNFQFNYSTSLGETTLVSLDSLAENGHWFWAVRTVDSKGARSAFSAIQDFYIDALSEPPASFSLVSPVDSSFIVTKTPTLDWADAADADPFDVVTYEVAISPFENFDSAITVGGLPASSYSVQTGTLTVRGRQYYWKVQATDTDNLSTPSNQVYRFTLLKLGDANKDGQLTAADIVILLGFIFASNPLVDPPEVADLNCSGSYTTADIVIALNAVFLGLAPPCDP